MTEVRDNELVDLIFRTGRCFKECLRKSLKLKISMVQMTALRFVHDQKRPTMHELSEFFAVSAPAATLLVDGLQKDHLVKRVNSISDRRSTSIVLTPKGKTLVHKAKKQVEKQMARTLKALSQKDKKMLAQILKKIGK